MKESRLLGCCLGHLKVIVSDRAGEPKLPLNDEITAGIVVSHCNVMNGKPKIFFPNNSMLLMAFPKKNTFDSSKNLTVCLPKLIFWGRF